MVLQRSPSDTVGRDVARICTYLHMTHASFAYLNEFDDWCPCREAAALSLLRG